MTGSFGRDVPPHSEEAELGIIGCCLMEAPRIDEAVSAGVNPEWFYDIRRRDIWNVLSSMRSDGKHIDMVTVPVAIRDSVGLERVGGAAALAAAMDVTPSPANLPYYLEIGREMLQRRKLIEVSREAISSATESGEIDAALDKAEAAVLSIRREFNDDGEADGKAVALKTIDLIQERCSGNDGVIPTGWRWLDRALRGGFRPGQMVVVAGRPGAGKTAFALSLMANIASSGTHVGMFSLEMDASEVGMRMIAAASGIDATQFSPNAMPTEQQLKALTVAGTKIRSMPIHVNDNPRQTARSLIARARRWVARHDVKLVIVDYLQLVGSESRKDRDRREVVDEISRSIKIMAKELKIPVIVLAQLNRAIERDAGRKPRLSDLRESGAIEQDADVVGFLYKHVPDGDTGQAQQSGGEDSSDPREINLLIAKQRSGPAPAEVRFVFRPEVTRFDPWAPTVEEAIN